MPTLTRLESSYERTKETGHKRLWGFNLEFPKEEYQAAYDFIVNERMPERMNELPVCCNGTLIAIFKCHEDTWNKEADAAGLIAGRAYPMSRTEKDMDMPCMESVVSGLPDFIQALKTRLHERQHSVADHLI